MKKKLISCMFICNSFLLFAQINEHFDGTSLSEAWQGDREDFVVSDNKLQLKAPRVTGVSYLSIASGAITNAEWNLSFQLNLGANGTSGSNYLRFYLCSDNPVLTESLNGYYLQIGGGSTTSLNKNIHLYRQQEGRTATRLNNGTTARSDERPVQLEVKVTKDDAGNWSVWSKKPDEADFIEEFTCNDLTLENSYYAGVVCVYTATYNEGFIFNSLSITGEAAVDVIPPALQAVGVSKESLSLRFSKPIDTEEAIFHFSEQLSFQTEWNVRQTEVTFSFDSPLESGKKYALTLEAIPDLAGNVLRDSTIRFGLVEPVLPNDIIINEVLFDAPTGGAEYIELYNRSNKVIDLSQLSFNKRSAAGALSSTRAIGTREILIFPKEYVVLTPDKDKVCSFYDCQDESAFLIVAFAALNNDSGTVVFTDKNKEVIDEFSYSARMHNPLIRTKRGVSLERQSPDGNEWVSASEECGFGTPGYQNSQYTGSYSWARTCIKLENDVCYPYQDKDGHLALTYRFAKSGYAANITIFTPEGRRIRQLGQGLLLATEGTIYWDGRDDNGRVVPISPYILLFEAFHPNGDVFRKSFVGIVSK